MNEALRKEWYSRADVQQNIIRCIREREVAFMVPYSLRGESGNYPVRCVKAHHSNYLLANMRAFNFFTRTYNLYHSIYLLKDMPLFTYHALKRKEQQNDFFKKYDSYVQNVDFVMDFDGDKHLPLYERIQKAKEQTLKVIFFLRQFNVPYCVIFSGTKGFHVEVRGFSPTRNWSKRAEAFSKVATRLVLFANGQRPQLADEQDEADLKELLARYSFDSSIYNVTRIWKVPFSYDVTTDMIAYPLTDEELADFHLEDYSVVRLLQKNHYDVGLKTRKGEHENFWLLAKELGVHYDDG